ncbi:putative sh3 domain-containing protein [Phaeoacremonium minimum UCRPA7]|uniref:Putative sh3 domain-containing protein n=1 Tax=Phaeoacremonium minimum (strain UCR-PA7) TaxID=1286976 RepID=R8BEI8_PHAM7|nr:putative sh3 domain-containing protein [Phaeoacremonium minimum UCRPA7]EON97712.1 putative sh3 domain-containing protein [Phaeoacremonium minimum UCRPA7]
MRGGLGVKRIKKQGLSTGGVEIAKCKFCPYELDFKQLERDINKEDSGNYRSSGIGFRLRFLQKSHLPAKHVEDQLYACLFCIQVGETLDESDSTVFFSQKQLFSHLARHPRPLPEVPGLTVIESKEIPTNFRNDYDLCFENPPQASQMPALARELSLLPSATAIEMYRSTPSKSIRRPPDGMKVLQFATGAKIVGVEFPAKYQGQWCVGWADHDWAAFPADVVRLDPPQEKDIRKLGTSNMKAAVRWKWSVKNKDRGDWLKLDKGDMITNINWTNSKGKWGIFPQSHIEPNSLTEVQVSDGASVTSSERKRSLRMPPLRHRSTGGSTDKTKTVTPSSMTVIF